MNADGPRPKEKAPPARRLPTLLWLFWRFLPPLDRADLHTLSAVGSACAYLAMPATVGLAAPHPPGITVLSLVCLAVPALPPLWWGAVRLGVRRRETALALRQARINTRAAAAASVSRMVFYPAAGAVFGAAVVGAVQRPLAGVLPQTAPLTVALHASAGHWLYAAPLAVVLLVALTALLGSAASAACYSLVRGLLKRLDRREAAPQPQ